MRNLIIVVEGATEEEFVKRVLATDLAGVGIIVHPILVQTSFDRHTNQYHKGGGNSWARWEATLNRMRGQFKGNHDRFTTLLDLYAVPTDTPGLDLSLRDTSLRTAKIESAIAERIADRRLIPYVQRHEMESLVLAALDELNGVLMEPDQRAGLKKLRVSLEGIRPEDVNDGPQTAPSKRLAGHIPRYRKVVHGPEAMAAAGLPRLRAACPRFNAWVASLEALGAAPLAQQGPA